MMSIRLQSAALGIFTLCAFSWMTPAWASELSIGGAKTSITPDGPVALAGQMRTRIARDVTSPVTANALALESKDGTQVLDQAILVSCDLVVIDAAVLVQARALLKDRLPDFDARKLVVSATHTHTAPVMEPGSYEIPKDGIIQPIDYSTFLSGRIADAAEKAWKSKKVGRVGWGLGHAVVAQNRRAIYADGRSQMYGPTNTPDFRGFEGPEDQGVEVLFFWNSDGTLIATAINVACPAQEVEGESSVNADFWHQVRQGLWTRHGEALTVLGWTGTAGDQSPHLMYRKQAEDRMRRLRKLSRLDEIARRILEAWDEAYEGARQEQVAGAALVHKVEDIELPIRVVTEAEANSARSKVEELSKDPLNRTLVVWHQRVVERYELQKAGTAKSFKMELHAIRLGDTVIATNVFELYTQFGIQIKGRSRAIQTFLIQLAGPGSYLTTEVAAKGGGYSAMVESNLVSPEGGQTLADRSVELINSLWPKE